MNDKRFTIRLTEKQFKMVKYLSIEHNVSITELFHQYLQYLEAQPSTKRTILNAKSEQNFTLDV